MTFRRSNDLETGYDGMVLEISIPSVAEGAFQDIITAGGSFSVGGYNGVISGASGNPIGGRQAWTGNTGGFVTTTVYLPASANGQNVTLRWRVASDNSVAVRGLSSTASCSPALDQQTTISRMPRSFWAVQAG